MLGFLEPRVDDSVVVQQTSKWLLFVLFIIQNAFVQLLFTQHWSFLGSLGASSDKAAWFAPVAGVGSCASTIAAFSVKYLSEALTLPGLLFFSSLMILLSAVFADFAYDVSEKVRLIYKTKYCVFTATLPVSHLEYDSCRMDLNRTQRGNRKRLRQRH